MRDYTANRRPHDPLDERAGRARMGGNEARQIPEVKIVPANVSWTLPPPITAGEFASARLTPDCIVEDYLFAHVAVIAAPGGSGKTTLMLYESTHITLGLLLYGLEVHKPGPVLIITAEDSREMLVEGCG